MEVTNWVTRSIPANSLDQSEVGNARRQAMALASSLDFSELHCGQLGIVVTEAARNLSAHGGGGEVLLTPWQYGTGAGIDVLALDKGRGIVDISTAMQDGYSTAGTPGTGLGAIQRLAHHLEIYSQPGKGTAMFARLLRSEDKTEQPPDVPIGSITAPLAGEIVSGDAWGAHFEQHRSLYMMADGLGHGPLAHEAAQEAIKAFHGNAHLSPKQILLAAHDALKKTRGAAIAVAEILHERRVLNYVGSGNIASSIRSAGTTKSLVTMNGTPGHNIGSVQSFAYPWNDDTMLLMHSDGLATRWNLDDYPGLAARHPSLIAGVLYRDFTRRRDDAAILVTAYKP